MAIRQASYDDQMVGIQAYAVAGDNAQFSFAIHSDGSVELIGAAVLSPKQLLALIDVLREAAIYGMRRQDHGYNPQSSN